jgi:SAM-dependent methyltransferase
MSGWYELVERDHDLQNPTNPGKIRLLGSHLRLTASSRVLDVACGKGGPAIILAGEYGCHVDGIELRTAFAEAGRRRIDEAGLTDLISITVADAKEVSFEHGKYDVALCLGAAFVWGHIGDAAAALASVVGSGRAIAVGEPFWRTRGRDETGFVDLVATVARFEAANLDLTGIFAASEDDWDRYESLHWRAAVEASAETGDPTVMETHVEQRDRYLGDQRSELGWAIFTGRVR